MTRELVFYRIYTYRLFPISYQLRLITKLPPAITHAFVFILASCFGPQFHRAFGNAAA